MLLRDVSGNKRFSIRAFVRPLPLQSRHNVGGKQRERSRQ